MRTPRLAEHVGFILEYSKQGLYIYPGEYAPTVYDNNGTLHIPKEWVRVYGIDNGPGLYAICDIEPIDKYSPQPKEKYAILFRAKSESR